MKKIKWFVYLIGLGLLLSMFITGIVNAEMPSIYTVQPGDSLSAISFKFYGNESLWKKIHKLNPQIVNPDLIYPGQCISLDPTIKISYPRPEPLPPKVYSRAEVYDKLIKHIFKVNDIRYVERLMLEESILSQYWYLTKLDLSKLHSQRMVIIDLQRNLRNLEFYCILDGIFEACKDDIDYRMTGLLTALAWQESHFNNVIGKHGEVTPFQFLPSTLKSIFKLDDIGLQSTMWNLKDDSRESAKLAYKWLMENGANKRDTLRALRWYNTNPDYPQYVIWKYNKIISIIKS